MGKKFKLAIMGVVLSAIPLIWCVAVNAAAHLTVQSMTVVDKSENVIVSEPSISGNTISSSIVFHQVNDNVTFNLALKNSTGTSFKIIDITDDSTGSYTDYTYDNHADEVIDAGNIFNFQFNISAAIIPSHIEERNQISTVKFYISYLDLRTGSIEQEEIILVPDTGENTFFASLSNGSTTSVLTFVAILSGAALLATVLYKKKYAAMLCIGLMVFSISGISFNSATAEDYYDLDVNITDNVKFRHIILGAVHWKNPGTGNDEYIGPDDFGELYYDADSLTYFGDIFDKEHIPTPANLMISGFKFTGTDIEMDPAAPILDDFDITIVYAEKTIALTYDYRGGIVDTSNPTSVKASDQPFVLNNPTRENAEFVCWSSEYLGKNTCTKDLTVDPAALTGDTTFVANYAFEVIINDQNGNELGRKMIAEGENGISYSAVFDTDHFTINSGSCTNGQRFRTIGSNMYEVDGVTSSTVCTLDITPEQHTVQLVVNNGVGSDSQTVNYSADAVFTGIAANTDYTLPRAVSCTNSQTATINNGTVTVNNVTDDTVCTVNALPPTIHTITYMQEMTPEICAATTTPSSSLDTGSNIDWDGSHYGDSNYIPRIALVDNRDNQKYLVEKLADGECWMMQNLSLVLSTDTRFTSENTDLNTISSYTPIRNTENIKVNVQNPYGEDKKALYTAQLSWYPEFPYFVGTDEFPYNGVTPSDSPTDDSDEYLWQKTGNLYSASAVTAGTYTFAAGTDFYTQDTICPKGWTLPDNALIDPNGTNPPNDKSFYKLMHTYSPNDQSTDYLHFAESGIFSQTFGGYYQSHQGASMSGFSTMDGVKHYTQVAYLGDYFRDAYGTGRSNPFILMYTRFLMPNYPSVQIQTSNSNVLTFHGAYARCIAR